MKIRTRRSRAVPIELIESVLGLGNVIQYLDARRALALAPASLSGSCWRLVEAQHHVSTTKITDTRHEQERLEALLEASKPAIPQECSADSIICCSRHSDTERLIPKDRDSDALD